MNTQLCDQASSLRGDVVSVRSASNGVAVIEMHDEAGKNTFTEELTTELAAAFERVGSDEQLRAVVLTGYGPSISAVAARSGRCSTSKTARTRSSGRVKDPASTPCP